MRRSMTPLSHGERTVAALMARDKSGPEIAEIMGVELSEVTHHRRRIYEKLRVGGIAGVTVHAVKQGWLPVQI